MSPHDVILAPVLSEKAVAGLQSGKYAFYVRPGTNRTQIKEAIERAFEVEVVKINLQIVRGKTKALGRYAGKKADRKKAIVTLKPGQRIQQLEGLT